MLAENQHLKVNLQVQNTIGFRLIASTKKPDFAMAIRRCWAASVAINCFYDL